MDPLSGLVLSALTLLVWGYITYFAVRRGIRDGFRDYDLRKTEIETEKFDAEKK